MAGAIGGGGGRRRCVESYDRPHHEISLRYVKDKIAARC